MDKISSCFIDANVWFAAARSRTGGSFLIVQLAKQKLVKLFANEHVLEEAERNLLLKSPDHLAGYYSILSAASPTMVASTISAETDHYLKKLEIPLGDIPVLAGAIISGASYLVSLDKKHLANQYMKSLNWPFKIVLPGEFLALLRAG